MAQEDIVAGVFGMTPEMYQAGQTQRDIAEQQAAGASAGGLFAKAYAPQIQQQAQLNARAIGGLLGIEDPQLQMVREVSDIRNQFDITTPEGMQSFAQAIAPKYPQLAMQALDKVATLEDMRSKAELRRAQADKALRGPVTSPEQLLTSGKYTPASVARYQQTNNIGDLQLVKGMEGEGEGVFGKPGAVGKSGAWRDAYGSLIPPAVMKDVHKEFKAAQNLYDTLNQVNEQDIKNAESLVDWTTKSSETKSLAKTATLKAQTKLAASQLMEQIGQLPPGSASDADMRASMKTFPGYSNPDALAAWVNETKRKLERTINVGVEQYGFTPNVKITPPLDLTKKKPAASSAAPDADALVNKYLTPKPR